MALVKPKKAWTPEEIEFVRSNPGLTATEAAAALGRPRSSVYNLRLKFRDEAPKEQYAKKAPGDYVEILAKYLTDDWECLESWCRWNGYGSYRILGEDDRGWVTLLCTAKG